MDTIELVEAMLYKMPNIRKAFLGLNIMSVERKISSSEHPEFKNILKPFKNPKIISIVGLTQLTAIVEPTKIGKVYPVILINGYNSEITELSKTGLSDRLFKHLRYRDYLPAPFVKKIIYISNYDGSLNGIVFSEYGPNKWTIDDPLNLPIKSDQKIGGKVIINEVISDLLSNGGE